MNELDFALNANPTRLCKHEIRDRETHELIGEIMHPDDAAEIVAVWNAHKKVRAAAIDPATAPDTGEPNP